MNNLLNIQSNSYPSWILYIIIGVVVAVAIFFFVLWLSHRSKKARKLAENANAKKRDMKNSHTGKLLKERELIDENVRRARYLVGISKDFPVLNKEVSKLLDKIRYSAPSADERIAYLDKKLANILDDLKARLSKVKKDGDEDALDIVKEAERLLADRNTRS